MTRGLPSAYTTALAGDYWRPVLFLQLVLSALTLRLHNYVGDIVWGAVTGTAQSGTSTTVVLATTASTIDGYYVGQPIRITSGTGAGSSGTITAYQGSSKIATVSTPWGVAPGIGSGYSIDTTWTGLGAFGSIGVVEEGELVSPYALTLQLSGIDTTLAPEVLSGSISGSAIVLYFGMLDVGAALLADPVVWWSGTVDAPDMVASREEETPSAIVLTCESDLAEFQRASNSLFSEPDLQTAYVGDTFFTYLPLMQDKVVQWTETRGGISGAPIRGGFPGGPRGFP